MLPAMWWHELVQIKLISQPRGLNFVFSNFDRTLENWVHIFLSLPIHMPNIILPFPVIKEIMSTHLTGNPATPAGAGGVDRVLCPHTKCPRQLSSGSCCISLLWFFSLLPPHQLSFLAAVSIPPSVTAAFPRPDVPFLSLFWSALGRETDDPSLSDIMSKIRAHRFWVEMCWVLLWVTCPKFVSPALAIQRPFIFGLSFHLYSAKWRVPYDTVTFTEDFVLNELQSSGTFFSFTSFLSPLLVLICWGCHIWSMRNHINRCHLIERKILSQLAHSRATTWVCAHIYQEPSWAMSPAQHYSYIIGHLSREVLLLSL